MDEVIKLLNEINSKIDNINTTGSPIERKVDSLGRVTLPKEFRRLLNIEDNQIIKMYVNGDAIIIKV